MARTSDLFEQLKAYGQSDIYPFHMPGHKRNADFLDLDRAVSMDVTEVDGFDDLHHPRGILREAQARAAGLYGAEETRFLVNGSSAGILAAIFGCVRRGGRILVARNCHQSVYHAIEMGGLRPVYIYPPILPAPRICGSIDAGAVRTALEKYGDIEAVVITSPTYEGVISDVAAIAAAAHQFRVPLIVDEAHGAHFGFDAAFPQTAVRLGADVVIQSLHKTLPSLTQTALLHMNGSLADRAKILKFYSYVQTTSPSYLMMASIDHCVTLLAQRGQVLFENYRRLLMNFLDQCRSFGQVRILGAAGDSDAVAFDKGAAGQPAAQSAAALGKNAIYGFDISKIVIYTEPLRGCGKRLYDLLLNQYHLQLEMASRDYCLAMTSICDTAEGFERLYRALEEIDGMDMSDLAAPRIPVKGTVGAFSGEFPEISPAEAAEVSAAGNAKIFSAETAGLPAGGTAVISPAEAVEMLSEALPFDQCAGRLTAEYACIYPPGVPFLVPGERIEAGHLRYMRQMRDAGFLVRGPEDETLQTLRVLKWKR